MVRIGSRLGQKIGICGSREHRVKNPFRLRAQGLCRSLVGSLNQECNLAGYNSH